MMNWIIIIKLEDIIMMNVKHDQTVVKIDQDKFKKNNFIAIDI